MTPRKEPKRNFAQIHKTACLFMRDKDFWAGLVLTALFSTSATYCRRIGFAPTNITAWVGLSLFRQGLLYLIRHDWEPRQTNMAL